MHFVHEREPAGALLAKANICSEEIEKGVGYNMPEAGVEWGMKLINAFFSTLEKKLMAEVQNCA